METSITRRRRHELIIGGALLAALRCRCRSDVYRNLIIITVLLPVWRRRGTFSPAAGRSR
jgi:hypothetical protein